ncbi:hypothetical protein D7X55_27985 [Corallococcus sp. AB049A]|uniref:Uncharacterized protein n=1 Tax=Corallococcus interemptor TaxID=2316720 RepID=A0A3A8QKP9_9BACT|nr:MULTISPECIES: hypothetical protein [Corallococcus]RKH41578.1 hypothetical protein D7Y23_32810 [Corallococcus sp. AB050B]RKH69233.1 hypothetical protein D7X96_15470 [Corallococcus interemptor]RKI57082.1 hypothetical protein D7X55_27985 [Corallococcus sp. AB049A]
MNVKALAAVVGTLSLGALATGCASNKAAEGSKVHAATPGAPEASESSAAPADGAAPAAAPAATPEKGAEGSCGAGSCGAGSCSGKK